MNIELEEVVVQDVTDDALEMAAGGQGDVALLVARIATLLVSYC